MLLPQLPEHIDPLRLADKQAQLQGTVSLSAMQRLQQSVWQAEGNAIATLEFGVEPEGVSYLKGQITANLMLMCQRCMQPFEYTLTAMINLGMVTTDSAASNLMPEYDPLIITSEPVSLFTIIEDELILSLPIVARHKPEECPVQLPTMVTETVEHKEKPFAILKKLK